MEVDPNSPDIAKIVEAKVSETYSGLVSKRDELLKETKELRERLNRFDPDRYERLVKAEEEQTHEAEQQRQHLIDSKKDFEALKAQTSQQMKKKDETIKQYEDRLQKLQTRMHKALTEQHLREAIGQVGGSARILLPHLKDRVRVAEGDDGSFTLEVLDENGRPLVNKKGDAASIGDLVASYREDEDFAPAFRSSVRPGSGARAAPVRSNGAEEVQDNPWAKGKENLSLQKMMERDDPDAAARLKAAAGVN